MGQVQEAILSIEKALDQGLVFQAHNIASEMLIDFPHNKRLIQLKVISLNRLGQPEMALSYIQESVRSGLRDGETMGLLGRTYKDLYKHSGDVKYLHQAAEAYFSGYLNTKEYYPAINAASLYLKMGDKPKAFQIAKEVIEIIGYSRDYWSTATLGEAYLILGKNEEAKTHFKKAIGEEPGQFGKFRSTFEQLHFLAESLDVPEDILHLFPKPCIVVFSGHMIDDPDRKDKRFPQEIEDKVKRALQEKIEELEINIGFTSLASGGDILFAELLQSVDAEVKAYMPFRKEDFIDVSVSKAGLGWIKRFEDCYDCSPKYLTHEPFLDTTELFRHLGKVMMGECLLFAEQFKSRPWFLTLLAPEQINKPGGTRDLISYWPDPDHHINIDPTSFITGNIHNDHNTTPIESLANTDVGLNRNVTNVLFADIVGFSKLLEIDTPVVILNLLKEVKNLLNPYLENIQVINTWGDAMIICHPEVQVIAEAAFTILNVFRAPVSDRLNLPEGLDIRIALHTGPVFFADDPLTGEPNAYGSTINRTARMEPVTLPGSIYASDQFAAILKLASPAAYRFRHVGVIELPKGFGRQEVYQITKI